MSRTFNFILNITITYIVLNLSSTLSAETTHIYQKLLVAIAVMIPTIFVITSYIKEKVLKETIIEMILFIVKSILIAYNLNLLNNYYDYMIILGSLSVIYILLAEFIFKNNKTLYFSSLTISSLIFIFINTILFLELILNYKNNKNFAILYLLLISLFSTLFIPIRKRSYELIGLGLSYSVFLLTKILTTYFGPINLNSFIYLYLILETILGTVSIILNSNVTIKKILKPTVYTLLFLALILVPFKINFKDIAIVNLILSIYFLVESIISGNALKKIFSYFLSFVGYIALLADLDKSNLIPLNGLLHNYSLALLFPTIGYFIYSEIRYFLKLDRYIESYNVFCFAVASIFMSLSNNNILWVNLFVVTLMLFIRFINTLSRLYLELTYLMICPIVTLGINFIYSKPFGDSIWIFTLINMIFLLTSSFISRIFNNLSKNLKSLAKDFSTTVLIFSVVITIISIFIDAKILLVNLLSLLIYSIIKLIETKIKEIIIISFLLLQSLVFTVTTIFELNLFNKLLIISITTLLCASIHTIFKFTIKKETKIDLMKISYVLNEASSLFSYPLIFISYFYLWELIML